ncbi:protoporphyrinogen/coproporphyrinogen oxidase [Timonella sp. A28]|uniref:protoporphyrinogen/coproporphyrinogen oxidase n=1 Tax=Timonella sp. A28 TaxID=3442640 RepID=UPI003EBCC9C1
MNTAFDVSESVLPAQHRADVVVVGAGISGLVAAYRLLQNGVVPLVVEASGSAGGFLAPLHVTDAAGEVHEFDAGAESFSTRSSIVWDLVTELGLETVKPSPAGAWCFPSVGQPFPLPKAGVLGIPSEWDSPDLLEVLGAEGVERGRADEWMNTSVGDRSNLAAFVASRMGHQVVDKLVGPIAGGVHSTTPDKLDVTAIHPNFWKIFEEAGSLSGAVARIRAAAPAGSGVLGIKGGLHRIISALVERISAGGGRFMYNCAVTSLARVDDEWRINIDPAEGVASQLATSRVVLATPAQAALGLLESCDIVSADEVQQAPAGTDISLVTLVVDCADLARTPSRGTGALIAPGGAIRAKGSTHANVKWQWIADDLAHGSFGANPHVIRFSYGRHGDQSVPSRDELDAFARRDFELIYGPFEPDAFEIVQVHTVLWPAALPPVTPQLKALSAQVVARVKDLPGCVITGSWISGTGLAATIPHADSVIKEIL